jgi:small subunit ribosomal protein S9
MKITKQRTFAGKRKTAVAKVKLVEGGKGLVFYNKLPSEELNLFHRLALAEPIRIHEAELGPLTVDIHITTQSGGKEAQIEASRLAIARALVATTGSEVLKKAYLKYDRNMIVQDFRRKETRKPGDSKARAMRQKSYR